MTGPAGGLFEAQVGTHYALCLLANSEPMGVPAAQIRSIAFQRAGLGHPFDDIILSGERADGTVCHLDIQVKRSARFTPGDPVFAAAVGNILETDRLHPDTAALRTYAVAFERSSDRIETRVQPVFDLARASPDTETFHAQLDQKGRFTDGHRSLRDTIAAHLEANGADPTPQAIFNLARRFVPLRFDYNRPASLAYLLDRDRAARWIEKCPGESGLAYHAVLSSILRLDIQGGETTREHLLERLRDDGVHCLSPPPLAAARRSIRQTTESALDDINTSVGNAELLRESYAVQIEEAIGFAQQTGGVVELVGDGGTGKSGLLKAFAQEQQRNSPALVLDWRRLPGGGAENLTRALGISVPIGDLFADMAADGGGVVCIDGIDRITSPEKVATLNDLLRAVQNRAGLALLVTARPGWTSEDANWPPDSLRGFLGDRQQIEVQGLNDNEASQLAAILPKAARLLDKSHPAHRQARNLFRLRRLLRSSATSAKALVTEVDLAQDWWASGDGDGPSNSAETLARRACLRALAFALVSPLQTVPEMSTSAVARLVASGSVHLDRLDRPSFSHDVFADWAVGAFLAADTGQLKAIATSGAPIPRKLTRGVELAARTILERSGLSGWQDLLAVMGTEGVHPTWRSWVLTALIRSETPIDNLAECSDFLIGDRGTLATELIHRSIALDAKPIRQLWQAAGYDPGSLSDTIRAPANGAWSALCVWALANLERMPAGLLSASLDLFENWLMAGLGFDPLGQRILKAVAGMLDAADADAALPWQERSKLSSTFALTSGTESKARCLLHVFAIRQPQTAERYVRRHVTGNHRDHALRKLLKEGVGTLPQAAPEAFAEFFATACEDMERKANREGARGYSRERPFSAIELVFIDAQPGAGPFLSLLEAHPASGIALIRNLLEGVVRWTSGPDGQDDDGFTISWKGEDREVLAAYSYRWPRGFGPSTVLSSALMALEYWSHKSIEAGRPRDEMLAVLLDTQPLHAAMLAIAVDIYLSDPAEYPDADISFLSNPDLLTLDRERWNYDHLHALTQQGVFSKSTYSSSVMPPVERQFEQKRFLAGQLCRKRTLVHQLGWISLSENNSAVPEIRRRLQIEVLKRGPWQLVEVEWENPDFMASHALARTDPKNLVPVSYELPDGHFIEDYDFLLPPLQQAWIDARASKHEQDSNRLMRGIRIGKIAGSTPTDAEEALRLALEVWSDTEAAEIRLDGEFEPNDAWRHRLAAGLVIARLADQPTYTAFGSNLEAIAKSSLARGPETSRHRAVPGQMGNNARCLAIALLLYRLRRSASAERIAEFLNFVALFPREAAIALSPHAHACSDLGSKWSAALARLGIDHCIFARPAGWNETPRSLHSRTQRRARELASRLNAETDWILDRSDSEPGWPELPSKGPKPTRQTIFARNGAAAGESADEADQDEPQDDLFDCGTAALWLRLMSRSPDASSDTDKLLNCHIPQLLSLHPKAQGADDPEEGPYEEWVRTCFDLAGTRLSEWDEEKRVGFIYSLDTLSDPAFLIAGTALLTSAQLRHIEGNQGDTGFLKDLRSRLWVGLQDRRVWQQHTWSKSNGMSWDLMPLISAFFFKVDYGIQRQGYLGGVNDQQLAPLMGVLVEMVTAAPRSAHMAAFFLDAARSLSAEICSPLSLKAALIWSSVNGSNRQFWTAESLASRVIDQIGSDPLADDFHRLATLAECLNAAGFETPESWKAD